mgnify:CR=1 FL=1
MTTLLLAAQLTASPLACTLPAPGPAWVCQDGGWLPPGHPNIRRPEPPPPPPNPLVVNFRVGGTYRRDATGVRIHITGLGALKDGVAVLAGQCLTESVEDHCLFVGQGRFITANASTAGWSEES